MVIDRRRYRRLNAPAYWRASGLSTAWKPVDVSLGGMRVYSDDAFELGARFELELFLRGEESIQCDVRVVWVDALPEGAPARFDIGIEFLELSDAQRQALTSFIATELE